MQKLDISLDSYMVETQAQVQANAKAGTKASLKPEEFTIALLIRPEYLYPSVREMFKKAFRQAKFVQQSSGKEKTIIRIQSSDFLEHNKPKKAGENKAKEHDASFISFEAYIMQEQKGWHYAKNYFYDSNFANSKTHKLLTRTFVFELLSAYLKKNFNSYGILTGVRPLKVVHKIFEQGFDIEKTQNILRENYKISKDKSELLTEVAWNNQPYINNADKKKFSLYLALPFCPSRCYYCSFPTQILKNYHQEIPPYLQALKREISLLARGLSELKLELANIYLGGGTPSLLNDYDLEHLLYFIRGELFSSATKEFSFEGGRADTLSPSKIAILKKAGVERLCINPQTMQSASLQKIGRKHSVEELRQAVYWAKAAGIKIINMDLIISLLGESLNDFKDSLEQVLNLEPENISIHVLAIKRGSKLAAQRDYAREQSLEQEAIAAAAYAYQRLKQRAYQPYYLYRQKNMSADLENLAYALEGKYCDYNIQVMEEKQNIIGLGVGANSKIIDYTKGTLNNLYNPRDIATYIQSVEKLAVKKIEQLINTI